MTLKSQVFLNDLDKILDFMQEHLKYQDRELIGEFLKIHNKYGTFDYAVDTKRNILGVCRWNLSHDLSVAIILDFAIRQDFRNRGMGKDFILRALKKFPKIQRLSFQRGVRDDDRERTISVNGILKRNIF